MSTELEPCPFCDGVAQFDHDDDGANWIVCAQCGASTNQRYSLMDDCKPLLAEQWNRRAAQPVSAGLTDLEILEAFVSVFGGEADHEITDAELIAVVRKLLSAAQRDSQPGHIGGANEMIEQLFAALRSVNAVAIERGDKFGVCDQIDNDGQPYPSQWLHDLLKLADLRQAERKAPEWQPIETAPKDGTRIMLGRAENDDQPGVSTLGWWQEAIEDGIDYMGGDAGFVDCDFQAFCPGRSFGVPSQRYAATQPTHWMPMQPAPSAGQAKPDDILVEVKE